jgi:hypothetical protein
VTACRFVAPWKGTADGRTARVFLAVPAVLALFVAIGVPAVRDSVVRLSHIVLLDKTQTVSYQQRQEWNRDAFKTATDTKWLGAGWGVCRASSFIPTLLGNVGLPGSVLFLAFCAQLFLPVLALRKLKIPVHGAVLLGLCAVLLDLAVSAPELAHPIIWLLFAIAAKLAAGKAPSLSQSATPYPEVRGLHAVA